jgi:outer membrane protein
MKNISLFVNAILVVAVGVLFVLHFSSKSNKPEVVSTNDGQAPTNLSIAYVNIDSVLMDYKLSVELNDAITRKHSNMKSKLESEAASLQRDAETFQDKVQKGIFLTQQRAEEAQQQLMQRQQELQNLEADYSNQLAQEQANMNKQLFDKISDYIKRYNTPEKYQFILGHSVGGSLLYSSKYLDITHDVLKGLNDEYVKETSNK